MKRTLTYLTTTVLLLTSLVAAQPQKNFDEQAVQNLTSAIQSDNTGLKKSAMYFVGYYKIAEAADVLKEELNNSSDPNIKILAALSLYEIGDQSILDDLESLSQDSDENLRVRKMMKAIHDQLSTSNFNYSTAKN